MGKALEDRREEPRFHQWSLWQGRSNPEGGGDSASGLHHGTAGLDKAMGSSVGTAGG